MGKVIAKKEKLVSINALILMIFLAGMLVTYWYFWQKIATYDSLVVDSNVKAEKHSQDLSPIKNQVIMEIQFLSFDGKYGQWPIETVLLSEDRGNPFRKIQ